MKYQQKNQPSFQRMGGQRSGSGQFNNARPGMRPVSGEIITSDEKSITVKLTDGSSKIILITDKTSINKAIQESKDSLKNGEKVMLFGQENSDGSITAQNIQVNPLDAPLSGNR